MFTVRENNNIGTVSKELDLLINLPKNCVCTTCMSIRNSFKISLGEKRFKQVCATYGLSA